jgi:hypothetical protein
MSCTNCYNGCVETVSDKCVRYTGADNSALSISTGDNLSYIEQVLIEKVASMLNGTGITLANLTNSYCTIILDNSPVTSPTKLDEIVDALVGAVCSLQSQVEDVNTVASEVANHAYTLGCLSGSTTGTVNTLQLVINTLCTVKSDLAALSTDVDTNYVKLADFNSLVSAYLSGSTISNQQYVKMVPYTIVEYYGPLTNFDSTGKGLSANGFDKIYICNGLNGTPDKRGRVSVGAISGVPGGTLDTAVDPATSGNPNYAKGDKAGNNSIVLTASQLPSHTHGATVSDPGHVHPIFGITGTDATGNSNTYRFAGGDRAQGSSASYFTNTSAIQTSGTGISVTNGNTGGGLGHSNIQPVIATNYIMYIP